MKICSFVTHMKIAAWAPRVRPGEWHPNGIQVAKHQGSQHGWTSRVSKPHSISSSKFIRAQKNRKEAFSERTRLQSAASELSERATANALTTNPSFHLSIDRAPLGLCGSRDWDSRSKSIVSRSRSYINGHPHDCSSQSAAQFFSRPNKKDDKCEQNIQVTTSWRFQPSWKKLVKMEIFPKQV